MGIFSELTDRKKYISETKIPADTSYTQIYFESQPAGLPSGVNWVIADKDTGVSAKGLTPFIGDNGNWWIGEEDTGVPASGGGHGNVFSNDVSAIRVLTRAEYDAIEKHDETVLYLITG